MQLSTTQSAYEMKAREMFENRHNSEVEVLGVKIYRGADKCISIKVWDALDHTFVIKNMNSIGLHLIDKYHDTRDHMITLAFTNEELNA